MTNPSNAELLVEAWLTAYSRINTQKTYRATLKEFQTWALKQGIVDICKLRAPHFDLYLSHLRSKGLADKSINSKQSAIRAFFNYLVKTGELKRSPILPGWVVRQDTSLQELPRLSPEEVVRVLDSAKHTSTRLVIAMVGLEGIKLMAVRQMEVSDITFAAPDRALVVVKRQTGSYSRPVGERSSRLLKERSIEVGAGPLLSEAELDRFALLRRIRAAAKAAGLDVAVTPRVLQGSYITTALASGVPLETLAKDLGRADRLQRYAAHDNPGQEGERLRLQAVQEAGQLDAAELLSQAKVLCGDRNITPIAPIVIAGAALEMVLRRMCEGADCIPTGKGSIDTYATALYRRKLVSKEDLGQVQASGKLRNAAAHGTESASVNMRAASIMIESVLLFISEPEFNT